MSFLGIDIGTSGLRAVLTDANGTPLGAAEHGYPTSRPHAGWSEQNPVDWIAALDVAVAQLREKYPSFTDLRGIAVAGQMHGATLLDAKDQVLRPCILWNDTRSHHEAQVLDARPEFRALSGNIVFAGFTAPKMAWLRTYEPHVFAQTAKVLLPAAFLTHYLTGEHVADMSDSAGTSWLDVGAREWSDDLLSGGHMRADQMPRLVEGSAAAGQLRESLAKRWGLAATVTVAGGAGDNAASACGLGVLQEGAGFVSLGTSGVVLLARDSYCPAPHTAVHTFCHAVPHRWYQMGVMLSAADSLSWLSRITGARAPDLTAALGATLRPPNQTRFMPYLSGERTPHNDADVRGGFVGLGVATTREDMTQAVLEGVCFGLRDAFEALKATGGNPEHLYIIGGGSASNYWVSLMATVLNLPLHIPSGSEFGAAMGAARLGMAAAGVAPLEEIMRLAPTSRIIDPVPELAASFDEAYLTFQKAYAALGQF